MKTEKFTPEEVIAALKTANGFVSKAAFLLKCHVTTVYSYADKYEEVGKAWEDMKEARHDYVENALYSRIQEGNVPSTIFYLKTKAKERGYVERTEQVIQGGAAPNIVIKFKDD